MTNKYFSIDRIKEAIEHLQNFDSPWVLVPLVFAVNGVNEAAPTNTNTKKRAGTDTFLQRHFSGELIGLSMVNDRGDNALRPRFRDTYTLSMQEIDYVVQQGTKLWANVYSSRGYREMVNRGEVLSSKRSEFQLAPIFGRVWNEHLPSNFHFEELLVWLYAFNGIEEIVKSWDELSLHFQHTYLGQNQQFPEVFRSRFHTNNNVPWPEHFGEVRPDNETFQRELYPSRFSQHTRASDSIPSTELNRVYFGAPGSGKSYQALALTGDYPTYIATFHPEYSYSDFLGTSRPVTKAVDGGEDVILYRFQAGVFLRAYCEAWKKGEGRVYLLIEEINRGNSAAIFGDVFQLLDRDPNGYSEYYVSCDDQVSQYLRQQLCDTQYESRYGKLREKRQRAIPADPYSVLLLPNNLSIHATMNTSDQSLFPMDSAFKRRWAWHYVPINYDMPDRDIVVGDTRYSWNTFLRKINEFIYGLLETEDKCLGAFFIKGPTISLDEFRNKVLFYLWNDVLRDELPERRAEVLPAKRLSGGFASSTPVSFNDFFDSEFGEMYVEQLLEKLVPTNVLENVSDS